MNPQRHSAAASNRSRNRYPLMRRFTPLHNDVTECRRFEFQTGAGECQAPGISTRKSARVSRCWLPTAVTTILKKSSRLFLASLQSLAARAGFP